MSEQNPKYTVYGDELVLYLNGDRPETDTVHSEGCFIADGDSLEVCRAAAKSWIDENGPAEIDHRGSGIGSIFYPAAAVYENHYDEDGELVETDAVDGFSALTEELRRRFDAAARSYREWLDHESEGYDEI